MKSKGISTQKDTRSQGRDFRSVKLQDTISVKRKTLNRNVSWDCGFKTKTTANMGWI